MLCALNAMNVIKSLTFLAFLSAWIRDSLHYSSFPVCLYYSLLLSASHLMPVFHPIELGIGISCITCVIRSLYRLLLSHTLLRLSFSLYSLCSECSLSGICEHWSVPSHGLLGLHFSYELTFQTYFYLWKALELISIDFYISYYMTHKCFDAFHTNTVCI